MIIKIVDNEIEEITIGGPHISADGGILVPENWSSDEITDFLSGVSCNSKKIVIGNSDAEFELVQIV